MLEDFQEQQQQRMQRMRSVVHFTVGTLLIIVGCLLLAFKVGNLADLNRKLLGGLFVLYGMWRLYRGFKKDKLR